MALIDHRQLLAVERPEKLGKYVAKFERIDFDGSDAALLESLRQHRGAPLCTNPATALTSILPTHERH